MINKNFLNEVLKTSGFICSYENVEFIEEFDFIYDNKIEFKTDTITSPIDNSYICTNRTINIFELNQLILMFLVINNIKIKEEIKKDKNNIIVNIELVNEDETKKSFLNDKKFEIENFNQNLNIEKLKLFNSFYLLCHLND